MCILPALVVDGFAVCANGGGCSSHWRTCLVWWTRRVGSVSWNIASGDYNSWAFNTLEGGWEGWIWQGIPVLACVRRTCTDIRTAISLGFLSRSCYTSSSRHAKQCLMQMGIISFLVVHPKRLIISHTPINLPQIHPINLSLRNFAHNLRRPTRYN